jgi:hypothetical protein
VQFVRRASEDAGLQATTLARVSSNQAAARGRLFLLVVDEANLSFAEVRRLDDPLRSFFAGLAPGDRVGLVAIPAGGVRVDFTDDVEAVRAALARVTGLETFDSMLKYNVSVAEMILLETRSPLWKEVLTRECNPAMGEAGEWCRKEVEGQARMRLRELRHRARTSLSALASVVESLGAIDGPKTLVLVSGGMVLEQHLAPGDYVARLTVTDRDGVTGEVLRSFRVPEPPARHATGAQATHDINPLRIVLPWRWFWNESCDGIWSS